MDRQRLATVVVPSFDSMKTFIAVKGNWIMRYIGPERGSVEVFHIAEIDADFSKISLLGSSHLAACLSEANFTSEVHEEQHSPSLLLQ